MGMIIIEMVTLEFSSTHSTKFLLALTQLHSLILRTLEIVFTPIPNNCIQYLCQLLTVNKSIQELVIRNYSISDSGITSICQALQKNSSLTILHLYYNPLITYASSQSLYLLLLNNSVSYIWTESMENFIVFWFSATPSPVIISHYHYQILVLKVILIITSFKSE